MHNFTSKLILTIAIILLGNYYVSAQSKAELLRQIATEKSTTNWLELKATTNLKANELIVAHKKALGLGNDDDLQLLKSKIDNQGREHKRFQQFYAGVEVEGAVFVVHEKNGRAEKANGHLSENIEIDVIPSLNEIEALDQALFHIDATAYAWQSESMERALQIYKNDAEVSFYPTAKLVVLSPDFSPELTDYQLAYKFDIYANEPHERWHIYIDAHNGDEILRISQICSLCENTAVCTGESHHNGTPNFNTEVLQDTTYMRDCDRNILTYNVDNTTNFYSEDKYLFKDADCNFIHERQKAGVDVHWATAQTYDFFNDNFACAGFDCNGNAVQSWVHFGEIDYNNAFYNGLGFAYSDGNGIQYNPFTTLDIVAHEYTHGITHKSAGLIYAYEAGALNESFSDIFGATIEYLKHNSESPWQDGEHWEIGERVTINGGDLAGIGLRSMKNPNALNDPDTYEGNNWRHQINCFAAWWNDYCGVHSNSGVQNHWFYLLSDGGNGTNDNGFEYSVNGIGIEKAAQIAYNSLTNYLTPTSTYFDARQAAIWAAEDLFGVGSTEVENVKAAWCAVGLGTCDNSTLTLTSPNGGEILDGGTIYEITWNSDTIATPFVKLTYSSDNGLSWKWIVSSVENDGDYDWFVPNILSEEVLIRIQDVNNPALIDVSDAVFEIDGCGTEAYFELADNLLTGTVKICQGETLEFNNLSEGSTHLEWLVNGDVVSYDNDFIYTFDRLTRSRTMTYSSNGVAQEFNNQKVSLLSVQMQGEDTLCTSLYNRYIYITPQPTADFTISLNDLEATFYAPLVPNENDNTTFYTWTFGDGATSNERKPTHVYSNTGTYNVCLTMENSCDSETMCKDISIEIADIACEGTWVNYTNTNDVKDMVEQNDSILWIATSGGLVRYNKLTESKTFYNSANSGLAGNQIRALDYREVDNTLWFIADGYLCKLDIATGEIIQINNDYCYDVKVDNYNNIWFTQINAIGKIIYATNEVISYNETNSNLPTTFYQIEIDIQNNIWFRSGAYLLKLPAAENETNGNDYFIYSMQDFGLDGWLETTNDIYPDLSYNKVWIRIGDGADTKFLELKEDNSYILHEGIGVITDNTNESNFWVPRGDTLYHFENGVTNTFYTETNMQCCVYSYIYMEGANIYIHKINRQAAAFIEIDKNTQEQKVINLLNTQGILLYPYDNYVNYIKSHPILGTLINNTFGYYFLYDTTLYAADILGVKEINIDEDNNIWFLGYDISDNERKIYIQDINTLEITTITFPFEEHLVFLEIYQNKVFVATIHHLYEYDITNNEWVNYNLPQFFNDTATTFGCVVNAIFIDTKNDLWVSIGGKGLFHWNGNTWQLFTKDNTSLPNNYIKIIAKDHQNNLWFASGGLTKFDGTNWITYTTENSGLAGNYISEIKTHSNGDIWVATNNGLSCFDGTNWKNYKSETSGLPTNNLASIEFDELGNVYVGGSGGGGLGILYNNTNITPSFTASSESICKNQSAFFTSTSTAEQGTISYTWLVDGVEVGNNNYLVQNFTEVGTHIVALIIDNGICENSISKSITVTPNTYDADVPLEIVGCGHGTVTLDANIDNVAAYSWQFNGVEVGNAKTVEVSEVGLYVLYITDNCGTSNSYFLEVVLDDDCVFAGDANYDGICNNYDVLALGVAFHEGGSARAVQLTNWEGYYCPDWQGFQSDSTNLKHADCNGDGFVNSEDFAAINQNYGETHDFSPSTPESISGPIQLIADNSAIEFSAIENRFSVPIDLQNVVGNTVATAGLAFDVRFSVSGADVSDAHFSFENSDLGTNNEILPLSKYFPDLGSTNSGHLEVALIRKDKSDISTQKIAELEVIVEEISTGEPLELTIEIKAGAKMISNNYILPINATISNLVIPTSIVCEIPTNLHESDMTSSDVTLNWNDMNAEQYRLAGRKKNKTWKIFDPQTDNFKTFTGGLQASTCYEWSVKAKCDGLWTDWQEVQEFCTSSAKNQNYEPKKDPFFTDSQDSFISDIQIFPNPTSDYINLSFISTKTESVTIVLSDILGKTVFTQQYDCKIEEEAFRFPVSDLPKGSYFLQIINSEETLLKVEKVSVL